MMGKSIHSKTMMHSGNAKYGYEDQKTKCRLLKSTLYTRNWLFGVSQYRALEVMAFTIMAIQPALTLWGWRGETATSP